MGKTINRKVRLLTKYNTEKTYSTTSDDIRQIKDKRIDSQYLRQFFNVPKNETEIEQKDQPVATENKEEQVSDEIKYAELFMDHNPKRRDLLNDELFQI